MRAYTVNSWGIFAYETLMVESPKVPDRQLAAFPKAWHRKHRAQAYYGDPYVLRPKHQSILGSCIFPKLRASE